MFLISDGTLNVITSSLVVDNPKLVKKGIQHFTEATHVPADQIVVNKVSEIIPMRRTPMEDIGSTSNMLPSLTTNTNTNQSTAQKQGMKPGQKPDLMSKINARLGITDDDNDPALQDPKQFANKIDDTVKSTDERKGDLLDLKDFMKSMDGLT